MAEKSKISWTDSTLNFWEGCTKVSAGCANCYAEARDKRFTGGKLWGKGAARRKSQSAVKQALAMNRKPYICDHCGNAFASASDAMCCCDLKSKGVHGSYHRRRIFSLSLGDWLDDEVPIEWLAEMFATIRQCDQVTWILCTKRPENWKQRMATVATNAHAGNARFGCWIDGWMHGDAIPKNIILLTSVENQEQYKRIYDLLKIPAACHGISAEPLLSNLEIYPLVLGAGGRTGTNYQQAQISWIIAGGESGPHARLCSVEWIRSLVKQGQAAGVATFVKQLGARPMMLQDESGAKSRGLELSALELADKKGGDPEEWPDDLRVQEWPKGF